MMDAQKMHIDHENVIDDAFLPLQCLTSALCDMNDGTSTVKPACIGVALRALLEKCIADATAALDAADATNA